MRDAEKQGFGEGCCVSAGADVNALTRALQAAPLHRAAGQGHTGVVQAL